MAIKRYRVRVEERLASIREYDVDDTNSLTIEEELRRQIRNEREQDEIEVMFDTGWDLASPPRFECVSTDIERDGLEPQERKVRSLPPLGTEFDEGTVIAVEHTSGPVVSLTGSEGVAILMVVGDRDTYKVVTFDLDDNNRITSYVYWNQLLRAVERFEALV